MTSYKHNLFNAFTDIVMVIYYVTINLYSLADFTIETSQARERMG